MDAIWVFLAIGLRSIFLLPVTYKPCSKIYREPGGTPSDPEPIGGEGAGFIDINKSVLSVEGNTTTYLYEVTNKGNTPQSNVYIDDEDVDDITYDSGDSNDNGVLDPGETWLFIGVAESS